MRFWQIMVLSIFPAAIVTALPFLPPLAELTILLLTQWPVIVVIWFGSYGVTTAALTAATAFLEIGRILKRIGSEVSWGDRTRVTPHELRRRWILNYLKNLIFTQYFTAVIVLLSLGLSRIPVDTPRFMSVAPLLADSPAFVACGAVIVVGLLGVLASIIPLMRAASRLSVERPEPLLIQPMTELLRSQTPQPLMPTGADAPLLSTMIERSERSMLEAVKDLASVIDQHGRGQRLILQAINRFKEGGQAKWVAKAAALPGAMGDATAELRTTLAALDASITTLREVASSLRTDDAGPTMQHNAMTSSASLSQLSTEFQELLREIGGTPPSPPGDDPPG